MFAAANLRERAKLMRQLVLPLFGWAAGLLLFDQASLIKLRAEIIQAMQGKGFHDYSHRSGSDWMGH